MAAYPSYPVLLDSTQELESGWSDSISPSGTLHSRQMHGQQYYRFSLAHHLTGTEFEALLATYAAGPRDVYTLTYRTESPVITYSVIFQDAPQIKTNIGGDKYSVGVELRGFKD